MARLPRLHLPGGVYSLVLRGCAGAPIFHSGADRIAFSRFVGKALRHAGARAHAFCWLDNEVSLALQIDQEPVGLFVRSIGGPYARWINRLRGIRGSVFEPRYTAVLVQEELLPALVRHIHWNALLSGRVQDLPRYQWSSHRAYLGLMSIPWLTTTQVLRSIGSGPDFRGAYREFMETDNEPLVRAGLVHGSAADARAFGDARFLAELPFEERRERVRLRMSLDELTEVTAETLVVEVDDIFSVSRRRHVSLARAVIAFHAVRGGIATLSAAAKYLGRDPSTLSMSIRRYRKSRPELFQLPITKAGVPALSSWKEIVRRGG